MIERRQKMLGITETYWAGLTEDQKIQWKFFSRTLAFVGALAVTKTGIQYIDWVVAACSTTFSFLLIEGQRSYTRYSLRMRKRLTRASIVFGAWCLLFAGLVYFAMAFIFAMASTFTSMPFPNADDKYFDLKSIIYILMFCVAGVMVVIKFFRELKFMDVIYHVPKQQMIRLLVHKEFELSGLPGFVSFELGVIAVAIGYSGVAATLLGGVIEVIRITASVKT